MIKNDLSDLSETTLIWRWRNLHPLKVQVQVNSAKKKGFDPLWGNQFVDPWSPKAPVLWEYLRKETPNKESHFHSILSGVSFKVGQANSVLFSRTYAQCEDCPRSAGQMANMTSCAGVKESHKCQRNKQNQWLLAISLANGAIQLQLATHSATLFLIWTFWVQSCLFLFAQRILKKNRIFKCLMANCKSLLCLLTIFVLTQSVLFWP